MFSTAIKAVDKIYYKFDKTPKTNTFRCRIPGRNNIKREESLSVYRATQKTQSHQLHLEDNMSFIIINRIYILNLV